MDNTKENVTAPSVDGDDQVKRTRPSLDNAQDIKPDQPDIKPGLPGDKPIKPDKPSKPPEDDGKFKLVVTITETYDTEEEALDSYKRFSGGGENNVVLKQGNKTISEKGWGARLDAYGHHVIDGKQHKIIYTNE